MRKFILLFFYFNIILSYAQTGMSSEVGITEGQLSVSLTGAANYSIPIIVPPGINGIVPQISLTYNSQGGNGLAGFGWNLSGISAISRIPATNFHDNNIDAVDFNSLDRFSFDGQRLVLKNTAQVYGAINTIYETEIFSNIKITALGTHPNGYNYGPSSFKVEYPDGSIASYATISLTEWAITYWQNPQGIRINYSYTLSNNTLSISSISYGSTYATAGINSLDFIYVNRNKSEQSFIGGQNIIRNNILKEIRVKGNTTGFRNYYLNYDITSLGYQRLISITEKSGDDTLSYNPTVFNYDTTNNSGLFNIQPPNNLSIGGVDYNNSSTVLGDYDGDGRNDLVVFPTTGVNAKMKFWLYNNLSNSSSNLGWEVSLGNKFEELFPSSWINSTNKLMPFQGITAVMKSGANVNFKNYSLLPYGVYLQDTKTFTWPNFSSPQTINSWYQIGVEGKFLNGDFNGDGITDEIVIRYKEVKRLCTRIGCSDYRDLSSLSTQNTVHFVNLDSRLTSNYTNIAGSLTSTLTLDSKIFVIDFNGDGKSDFMILEEGNVKIYSLNTLSQLVLLKSYSDAGIKIDKPVLIGDYNGDGKADFLIPQTVDTDSWSFYFSTGNSIQLLNTAIGFSYVNSKFGYFGIVSDPSAYSLSEVSYIPSDINGDGKTDIIYQENYTIQGASPSPVGTPQVTRFYVLENKFASPSSVLFNYTFVASQFGGVGRFPIAVFTNHNKLNQNLEYSLLSGNSIRTFNSTKDHKTDVALKSIITGNGVSETITYK